MGKKAKRTITGPGWTVTIETIRTINPPLRQELIEILADALVDDWRRGQGTTEMGGDFPPATRKIMGKNRSWREKDK